jgi:DNA-directed RNA polymerase specialized sigma24 family protein
MPGRYVTDAIYDRLRSIGVSVETADALAPVVAGLSPRKREAFFLWASGMTYRETAKHIGRSIWYVQCIIKKVQNAQKMSHI